MSGSAGFNVECLLLSASKRTLDSCVAELASHVPETVKSVIVNPQRLQRDKVFRDDLLTFHGFQSVCWGPIVCPPAVKQINLSLAIHHFLILGYVNGIQIWCLRSPVIPSFSRPFILENFLPSAHRVLGFRTASPVTTIQLLPNIPNSVTFHTPSGIQSRLALVQEKGGCQTVEIFGVSSCGSVVGVHVLQQPWPVMRLAASASYTSSVCENSGWTGSLIVATSRQIRVYETNNFDIRFSISDFLSVATPPFWRWLVAENPESFAGLGDSFQIPNCSKRGNELHCWGPVFVVGSRWLIYQKAKATSKAEKNLGKDSIEEPTTEMPAMTCSERQSRWISPVRKFLNQTSRLKGFRTRRPFNISKTIDTILSQVRNGSSFLPLVETLPGCQNDEAANPQPIPKSQDDHRNNNPKHIEGGDLVAVDLIHGEIVGYLQFSSSSSSSSDDVNEKPSQLPSPLRTHHGFLNEAQDGVWCLSHIENAAMSPDNDTDNHLIQGALPAMAFLSLDVTGTTLFCAEWTGRTVWVCRLCLQNEKDTMAKVQQQEYHRQPFISKKSNSDNVPVGIGICGFSRGTTLGSVTDISASLNLMGEGVVMVASNRGSGHYFSLPEGFHLSIVKSKNSKQILQFPDYLSVYNKERRDKRTLFDVHNQSDHHRQPLASSSDSDTTRPPTIRSKVIKTDIPPSLPLRLPETAGIANTNALPKKKPISKLSVMESNSKKNDTLTWKSIFIPSPFLYLPTSYDWRTTTGIQSSTLGRIDFLRKNAVVRSSASKGHSLCLPFVLVSSDGVIDFCHSEFTSAAKEDFQSLSFTDDPPLVRRRTNNHSCYQEENNDSAAAAAAAPVGFKETSKQNTLPSKVTAYWNPHSYVKYKTTTIVRSLSTRNLDSAQSASVLPHQNHDSNNKRGGAKQLLARFCEPITSRRKNLIYFLRLLTPNHEQHSQTPCLAAACALQNTNDLPAKKSKKKKEAIFINPEAKSVESPGQAQERPINVALRSGVSPFPDPKFLENHHTNFRGPFTPPDQSYRVRHAMDAALRVPLTLSRTPQFSPRATPPSLGVSSLSISKPHQTSPTLNDSWIANDEVRSEDDYIRFTF